MGFGIKGTKCEVHHLLPSNSKAERERERERERENIGLPELEQKHTDNFAITFKILRLLTAVKSGKY